MGQARDEVHADGHQRALDGDDDGGHTLSRRCRRWQTRLEAESTSTEIKGVCVARQTTRLCRGKRKGRILPEMGSVVIVAHKATKRASK